MSEETIRLNAECSAIHAQAHRVFEFMKTTDSTLHRVEDARKTDSSTSPLGLPVTVSSSPLSHSSAIEERLALMQTVEQTYQHAVLTQSASKREQETIKINVKKITQQYLKDREEVAILDQKILDLKTRRTQSEESLREYTDNFSLKNLQDKYMNTVDYHETTLRDLELDRNHLLLLTSTLVRTEESLRNEIAEMRDKILEYHRNKIKVKLTQKSVCVFYFTFI